MFLQRSCPVRPTLPAGAILLLSGSSLNWGAKCQVWVPIPAFFGRLCPAQPCSCPARPGTGKILNRDTNSRWSETWKKYFCTCRLGPARLGSARIGFAQLGPGTDPSSTRHRSTGEPGRAGRARQEQGRDWQSRPNWAGTRSKT